MANTIISAISDAITESDVSQITADSTLSSSSVMDTHRQNFISSSLSTGALKFGSFTLKSGRTSPYFFNAGLLSSGPLLNTLASAYAALIHSSFPAGSYDVLFGPAYKGIALAAATALCLSRDYNVSISYAYNRKEAKTHGEGGWVVGAPLKGQKVLILDDVITAGTAVREAIDGIEKEGGKLVGVVVALDREEVGGGVDGGTGKSAVKAVDEEFLGGKGAVKSVVGMRDLMRWLDMNGRVEDLKSMQAYWERYGVKEA